MSTLIKTPREKSLFDTYKIWLHSDKPIPNNIIKKFNEDIESLARERRLRNLT